MDRFACYELCVQSPRHVVPFLRAVHGGEPGMLREDFCGTGALARRWVEEGRRASEVCRAMGVDLDAEAADLARRENERAGMGDAITVVQADATALPVGREDGCDVVFVGTFPSATSTIVQRWPGICDPRGSDSPSATLGSEGACSSATPTPGRGRSRRGA